MEEKIEKENKNMSIARDPHMWGNVEKEIVLRGKPNGSLFGNNMFMLWQRNIILRCLILDGEIYG